MTISDYSWFVLALVLVVGLILGAGRLARWLGVGGVVPTRVGRQRRLSVSEVLAVDSRTKAVLLRRDGVEHLVLIGAHDTRVLETRVPDPSAPPAERADEGEPPK